MKYDVTIADEHFEVSWAMRPFFRAYYANPHLFDGKDGEAVGRTIRAACRNLFCDMDEQSCRALKARFDTPWDTVEGACEFLTDLHQACLKHPDELVRVG